MTTPMHAAVNANINNEEDDDEDDVVEIMEPPMSQPASAADSPSQTLDTGDDVPCCAYGDG